MKICILFSLLAVVLSIAIAVPDAPTTTSSYLQEADKLRFKKVLQSGLKGDDLSTLHYAVLGYKLMDETIPNTAELCKYLLSHIKDGTEIVPETTYYITTTWNALGICQPLQTSVISKALTTIIEKETTSIPDLYYSVMSLTALSQKLSKVTTGKLVKTLQTALKKDDSLWNLGYMFHIAAQLGPAGDFTFERIEDAIVQADEVDGRYLQFEGGLSVTSIIVNGVLKLSSSLKRKPPMTSQQVVKFANYILSRRSVQMYKGIISLLSALTTLANDEFYKPVCITLADDGLIISAAQPSVKVRVCDVLGRPLDPAPKVMANSATRVGDDVVVISKEAFKPSPQDKTLFTMNLMDIKPERGFYKISVSAGSVSNSVTVKVLAEVVVDYLDIGTGDADQTTQPKLTRVAFPNKLSQKIEADSQQKLVIRFLLKDSSNKKSMRVHQAFVRLYPVSKTDKQLDEIIFVAEPDASNVYKFDMAVESAGGNFGHQSGDYNVELIVGDALLGNSFQWTLAMVSLKFPEKASAEAAKLSHKEISDIYQPKPEIKHMFREPEKRPPVYVSNLFTGLCLAPVLLLLVIWAKLGVNISNFPFSLSAILFHLGLGSIFALLGIFWLKLNMFVTLRYLLCIGLVTFLAGNKLLSHIARSHKTPR